MPGRRPKWGDVHRFCELQGFTKRETDHTYFDKTFWNRETAGTKISRGVDGETLTKERWVLVWKRQLKLKSEDDFWRGLEGDAVAYNIPSPPPTPEPLPSYLRNFLASHHYMTEEEIAVISRDEALRLWHHYLLSGALETDSSA